VSHRVIESSERIIEALYRIVHTIQQVADLPTLLATIMAESKELLECETSSLFLYDPERNDLFFEVVIGDLNQEAKQIRVPMGVGIVGAAAAERKTQIVQDCSKDARHFGKVDKSSGFVTRNLIAAPMIRNERLIGVLEVLNKLNGEAFDEMDARVMEIMAEHAAAAIENARLIQANIRAERLAALGTATASLAHYIKNILTPLHGSTSLIDMGLANQNFEIVGEAWPIMKRATTKIGKLVQDMLSVSREREPERADVDLNRMIGEILADCQRKAAAAGIELKAALDDRLPPAMLDPNRMHDSILNLIGNAIEALEEARTAEGRISATTHFDAERAEITIRIEDNGPGMPPHVRQKVFEPFFSTKGSRGTGLGLAVVKKTMEEHGGSLRLDTEVGRGTTFTLKVPHLPVEPEVEAAAPDGSTDS